MTTTRNFSFAAGEVSPSVYSRVDLVKYQTGLRTCRNFLIARHGSAFNRPGTSFVGQARALSTTARLIPFVFNASQTYVLEFGNLYMRVHRNGAQVTETAVNITGITQANPAVVTTSAPHGYSNGDRVYITGAGGMTQVNNYPEYIVANVAASTFELQYPNATNVDSTGFTAYTTGGTAARIYQITTPYATADLFALNFVQSADVITIVHPTYAPRELSRTADTSWTLATITFGPEIARPTNLAITSVGTGSGPFRYKVTAIDSTTGEESLAGLEPTVAITGATQANPVVITAVAHGFEQGDEVFITGVGGMTQINDRFFTVGSNTANTFELQGEDGTGHTAYSGGGTVQGTTLLVTDSGNPTAYTNRHVISWNSVSGASLYNIYRDQGIYGFVGSTQGTQFLYSGYDPDLTKTPPQRKAVFAAAGDFPSAVTYYQQRLVFGNTNNNPERIYLSRTGSTKNFTTSAVLVDDSHFEFSLFGREVNQIRHLIDVGTLIVMTSGGEWRIAGDAAGVLTPTAINARQQTYYGSSTVRPIVVGNQILYVQARGSIIRNLSFDFEFDGYSGEDLTIFSSHLVDSYTIVDWTYQQSPNSVIWITRSDGTLLGMTYVREHQLLAWHRHDFDNGAVESVCVVPEGTEDYLYLLIRRTIDGQTLRYVERLNTRTLGDIEDAVFVDSELSYDGTNTNVSHTMTLSGGTNWTYDETLTLTSSAVYFTAADVGNAIHLTGSDGTVIRFSIDAFTNTTVVTGHAHKTVPAVMRNTAISTWTRAVDEVTGLWHLEGETVSVFADGFVVGNPNNDSIATTYTVANGAITLDRPYGIIHVGLPITADLETLDIDTANGETLIDKNKMISHVTFHVESSRGLWAGAASPGADNSLSGLRELKIRGSEAYDAPVSLSTRVVDLNIRSEWNSHGRVFVRQTDPVPLAILSIAPAGLIPYR